MDTCIKAIEDFTISTKELDNITRCIEKHFEEEIFLLKDIINNQHRLIISAEQRGYQKAKRDIENNDTM